MTSTANAARIRVSEEPTALPALRLTRRGRFVVFAAACLLAALAVGVVGNISLATDSRGTDSETELIQVDTGQTLWGIASERAGSGNVRAMMSRIKELNALESSMLMAGQKLYVPAS